MSNASGLDEVRDPPMLEQAGGAIVKLLVVAGVVDRGNWNLCCVETRVTVSRKPAALEYSAQGIRHQRSQSCRDRHRDDRSPSRWPEYEEGRPFHLASHLSHWSRRGSG